MNHDIAVVTKAPNDWTNMAAAFGLFIETEQGTPENDWTPKVAPLAEYIGSQIKESDPLRDVVLGLFLSLREPVFHLGEILFFERGQERDIQGRKPSKWGVEVTEVSSIEEALDLSQMVTQNKNGE